MKFRRKKLRSKSNLRKKRITRCSKITINFWKLKIRRELMSGI